MNRRRSSFSDASVSYAAVGASLAPDVMAFPPPGFRSAQTRQQLGSGQERFEASVDGLLSWRMVDAAGFNLEQVEKAAQAGYAGPGSTDFSVDDTGEVVYSSDGRGHITPGDVVTIRRRGGAPFRDRRFRVVAVTRDPGVVSLVFGTIDSEPFVGEFLIGVYHLDDDTVWSQVIQVVAPGTRRLSRMFFGVALLVLNSVRGRLARGLNPARVVHAIEAAED